jgi:hypothetical protein
VNKFEQLESNQLWKKEPKTLTREAA